MELRPAGPSDWSWWYHSSMWFPPVTPPSPSPTPPPHTHTLPVQSEEVPVILVQMEVPPAVTPDWSWWCHWSMWFYLCPPPPPPPTYTHPTCPVWRSPRNTCTNGGSACCDPWLELVVPLVDVAPVCGMPPPINKNQRYIYEIILTLLVADLISPSTKSCQCTCFDSRSWYFCMGFFLKKEDTSFWNISDTWQATNIAIYCQNGCIGEIWYLARLGRQPVIL